MIAIMVSAGLAIAALVFAALYFSRSRVADREFRKQMRAGGLACGRSQEADMMRVLERHYAVAEPENEISRQLAKRRRTEQ